MSFNTSNNKGIKGLVRVYCKTCTSTQSVIKAYVSKMIPKQGFYVLTDFQSEGRGQHGSNWESLSAKNVLMSIYLTPMMEVRHQYAINMWATLAIVDVLREQLKGHCLNIKWPNDVLVNNLKIAGVLPQLTVRSNQVHEVYLGIGLNLNQKMTHTDYNATSVKELTGNSLDRFSFAERLKEKCIEYMTTYPMPGSWNVLKKRFETLLWKCREKVQFEEAEKMNEGIILGINEHGQLNMQTNEGLRSISMKEVIFTR